MPTKNSGNGHRPEEQSVSLTIGDATGPVLLALSTFRQSDKAIDTAIERAAKSGALVVVYVADKNLARYFIGSDMGAFYPDLRGRCEEELLKDHKLKGTRIVRTIAERAKQAGLNVSTHVRVGRFALICLEVARKISPSLIVTTRSLRPAWVRTFFGSPVDQIIAEADCEVLEV